MSVKQINKIMWCHPSSKKIVILKMPMSQKTARECVTVTDSAAEVKLN